MLARPDSEKAFLPIEVTELGISMLVRLSHSEKALFPIEMTELGISMFVRFLHSEKALSPIEVTEYSFPEISTDDGIVTEAGVVGFLAHATLHSVFSTSVMI